jgi:hypothetical protein
MISSLLLQRFVDVITPCLHIDAHRRATVHTVLKLPWFVAQGVTSQRSATTVLAGHLSKGHASGT